MTHIGIIGLGKMGSSIESLLKAHPEASYSTFTRVTTDQIPLLKTCNVVIEFTTPDAAPGIIRQCLEADVAIVSGTTGWHEYHLESMMQLCRQRKGKFLYATNFSVGMNITFALNRKLADIMNKFPQFIPSLKEIHHIHKKDMPSGTAYTLFGDIIDRHNLYESFRLNASRHVPAQGDNQIDVTAIREGEVKGYHEVSWSSGQEKILISHEAYDRKIFAEGAILAAHWLAQRYPGIYTMNDIIDV
jgi:4-hydroxy-tetrahydrodipicolinate reductase